MGNLSQLLPSPRLIRRVEGSHSALWVITDPPPQSSSPGNRFGSGEGGGLVEKMMTARRNHGERRRAEKGVCGGRNQSI